MADTFRLLKYNERENCSEPAAKGHSGRRNWTLRGAIAFWVAASGLAWLGLAASAIWVY